MAAFTVEQTLLPSRALTFQLTKCAGQSCPSKMTYYMVAVPRQYRKTGCSPLKWAFECWPSYIYTCPPCLYQSSQPMHESHTRHRNATVSRHSQDPQLLQSSSIKEVKGHHRSHLGIYLIPKNRKPSKGFGGWGNHTDLSFKITVVSTWRPPEKEKRKNE